MSNLGAYQTFTTFAKKVGGPVKAIGIIAGGGYGVGKFAEAGVKKVVKIVRGKKEKKTEKANQKTFVAKKAGTDDQGLIINAGDKIKILEKDGDVVLIEVVGREDNPFYVSAAFLKDVIGE